MQRQQKIHASLKEKILLKKKRKEEGKRKTKTTVGKRRLTSGCNGL